MSDRLTDEALALRAEIERLRAIVAAADALVATAREMHDEPPCMGELGPDPDVKCACDQWDGHKNTPVNLYDMQQLHSALADYDRARGDLP